MTLIMFLYYVMTAYVVGMLIWNFIKTKDLKSEILYTLALLPLILRLLRMR